MYDNLYECSFCDVNLENEKEIMRISYGVKKRLHTDKQPLSILNSKSGSQISLFLTHMLNHRLVPSPPPKKENITAVMAS